MKRLICFITGHQWMRTIVAIDSRDCQKGAEFHRHYFHDCERCSLRQEVIGAASGATIHYQAMPPADW